MLMDAAMIQEADARCREQAGSRAGKSTASRSSPSFKQADALAALEAVRSASVPPAPSRSRRAFAVTLFDAGHVLGSAVVALDIDEGTRVRRVVFTGDLGPQRNAYFRGIPRWFRARTY